MTMDNLEYTHFVLALNTKNAIFMEVAYLATCRYKTLFYIPVWIALTHLHFIFVSKI